jgi:hypothetical protein
VILAVGMAEPIWSEEDIAQLKAAILELASGEKVKTVRYGGPPPREVDYHQIDLPDMRALLADIVREVRGTTTYRRVAFNKGFRGGC